MSIKLKIILIAALPVAVLIFFSISGIQERAALSLEFSKLRTLTQLTVGIGDFIHETQKERGRTGVFLGSHGKTFVAGLKEQRRFTDTSREILTNIIKSIDVDSYETEFASTLNGVLQEISQLDAHRKKVDAFSISGQEGIAFYTRTNAHMIDLVRQILKITPHGDIARITSAYVNFMDAKEKAGVERAIMTVIFSTGRFSSLEEFFVFNSLIAEQKTLIRVFESYADRVYIDFYNQKMSDSVVAEIESIRLQVLENHAKENLGDVDAAHWFDIMTRKINLMKEVEDTMAMDLSVHLEDVIKSMDVNAQWRFWVVIASSVISVFLGYFFFGGGGVKGILVRMTKYLID